jgi:hypothetical protein
MTALALIVALSLSILVAPLATHAQQPTPVYLKERNLTVWHVVGRMQAHGYSSAEAAEQFDVPLEAVLEAVDYYQRHKDLVDADTAEEGRRLRAAGLWE